MLHDQIIQWGISSFIFALLTWVSALGLSLIRRRPRPKDEPERFPEPTDEQAILGAMNSLEALIDWRKGNTDSNLILDNSKWKLFRRATEEFGGNNTCPTWT